MKRFAGENIRLRTAAAPDVLRDVAVPRARTGVQRTRVAPEGTPGYELCSVREAAGVTRAEMVRAIRAIGGSASPAQVTGWESGDRTITMEVAAWYARALGYARVRLVFEREPGGGPTETPAQTGKKRTASRGARNSSQEKRLKKP
jgi:transcriptional regulator with XRE-family HTH domain